MIQVSDVWKIYNHNKVEALKGVSLNIKKGEFLIIMGPSGSGKSTLINMIGGLDRPTRGNIIISGKNINQFSEDQLSILRRDGIGLIFQFFNLLPTLTAAENIALPLYLKKIPKRKALKRVDDILELVGLPGRKNHYPEQLSGGEMQRVAIARALVINPVMILADEPTGNLDSNTGEAILKLIKFTAEKFDCTVIMVTHNHRIAQYGDRIITFKDGRTVDV